MTEGIGVCLYLDSHCLEDIMERYSSLACEVLEASYKLSIGSLYLQTADLVLPKASQHLPKNAKRKTSDFQSGSAFCPKQQKKDVGQIFQELKIIPDVGSDLQCALCPYKATQKPHLKTHYKLKHLGGADLIMNCQICKRSIKTKSALKKHIIQVHGLDEEAARKLIN